jgi:hypothetical protein
MKRGDIRTVAGGKDYANKPRPVVIVQDDNFDATDSITSCAFTTDETIRRSSFFWDWPFLHGPFGEPEGLNQGFRSVRQRPLSAYDCTFRSSTSKISVAPGGMVPSGVPWAP